MDRRLKRLVKEVRSHPRLILGGAGSLAAAAGAAIASRRRKPSGPTLPDPDVVGAETAIAVHNAAKGTVISAVRTALTPEGRVIDAAAGEAMREAARTGVDLVPVAVGVVEGGIEVAHVVGESPLAAGQRGAAAAVQAAEAVSHDAAERVRQALTPYLEHRTDPPSER